ncbi:hypothetical protein A2872_03415 [Candidatus Gottesmanbacteria bacterium RIFCSPHIGHO2_01_FULL_42_12]|uniref:Nudix hydrolase domain-containing protein n=1 Tax=Candidatus Gottesmanbacteria bacterium RIFCSPHIGHO2_01_FULL_42_12 TaxID=1798377 RepID=A0A1F5Z4J2_9BACT|nr:MAG: hypothetical protein A2872_03415 [Candidatus Gottesmanbacteria bacterium RIFCSPHIGHO2_01_FULL_42_12]
MSKLFNKARNGAVIAHDIFGKQEEILIKDLKLRVSVYGILKLFGKVLLQRHPIYKTYSLPGGGIEIGETVETALIREYEEETGLKIKIRKLLDVKDDFFFHENFKVHSVLIFYEVEKVSGELLVKNNYDDSELAEFVSWDNIKNVGLQEKFLEVLLNQFPEKLGGFEV